MGTGRMLDTLTNSSVAVSNSWEATDLIPGAQLPERYIEVLNFGELDADHVDVEFSYTGNEDIARSFIFDSSNRGFRYGGSGDDTSVNLITALKGTSDSDYIVTQGATGEAFRSDTVDGIDGTLRDGQISLNELAAFGKIRIQGGTEQGGLAAGTSANLWLNARIANELSAQNENINVKITFSLDQDSSQF